MSDVQDVGIYIKSIIWPLRIGLFLLALEKDEVQRPSLSHVAALILLDVPAVDRCFTEICTGVCQIHKQMRASTFVSQM